MSEVRTFIGINNYGEDISKKTNNNLPNSLISQLFIEKCSMQPETTAMICAQFSTWQQ